jgi:hypothetical protein
VWDRGPDGCPGTHGGSAVCRIGGWGGVCDVAPSWWFLESRVSGGLPRPALLGLCIVERLLGEVFALHCWIETREVLLFEDSCI